MVERDEGGERLSPAEQFTTIIDGHFDAINDSKPSGVSEEWIFLLPEEAGVGFEPQVAHAFRPIEGQNKEAARSRPEPHGHYVRSYTYPQLKHGQEKTYFLHDNELWVRNKYTITEWRNGVERVVDSTCHENKMDERQRQAFLDWLRHKAVPITHEAWEQRLGGN